MLVLIYTSYTTKNKQGNYMTHEIPQKQVAVLSDEDLTAAEELLVGATTAEEIANLREMLVDQNGGNTTITKGDGEDIEVTEIGHEKFKELVSKALNAASENVAVHSDSWRTDKK